MTCSDSVDVIGTGHGTAQKVEMEGIFCSCARSFWARCVVTFIDEVPDDLAPDDAQLSQADARVVRAPLVGGLPPHKLRLLERFADARGAATTVHHLAKAVGLSKFHFARAFKQSTGHSPYRWLMLRRIDRAKQTLLATEKTLAEIALEAGFASQQHFTTTFNRHVGVPPGTWRRDRTAGRSAPGS